MILPRYHVAASAIPGAGKGLFLDEPVAAGRVLTAPDGIDRTFRHAEIAASPALSTQWLENMAPPDAAVEVRCNTYVPCNKAATRSLKVFGKTPLNATKRRSADRYRSQQKNRDKVHLDK